MTSGLSLFAVKVESPAIDPAPAAAQPNTSERDSIKVEYVKGGSSHWHGATYRQLQAEAKRVGVKANGTRAALIAALIAIDDAKGE